MQNRALRYGTPLLLGAAFVGGGCGATAWTRDTVRILGQVSGGALPARFRLRLSVTMIHFLGTLAHG